MWCFVGRIPEHLQPLTMVEENLLGMSRVHRQLFLMKRYGTEEKGLRAHVLALPNVDQREVRRCILQHPKKLAETLQVVFLVLANPSDEESVTSGIRERLAKDSPALKIRVKEVVKWAEHLAKVRGLGKEKNCPLYRGNNVNRNSCGNVGIQCSSL
jgi:hypothetical protein